MMPGDPFFDPARPPHESALSKRIGPAFALVHGALVPLNDQPKADWKFSKTSGWYLVYQKGRKRLFYLFPKDQDFALKIVFNDRALAQIMKGSLPKPILQMAKNAREYPEGHLLVFTKDGFDPVAFTDLLRIKLAD
jgi:hypothetical protein